MSVATVVIARLAVNANPKLSRGKVWCTECGRMECVDSFVCLRFGWPKCCGYTMTIDSPEERSPTTKETP